MARYRITWLTNNHSVYGDPADVYLMVLRIAGCYDPRACTEEQHRTASEAQGWCELHGCPGEQYDDTVHGFTIDVI